MSQPMQRRKRHFVNAGVQGRILGRVAGYWVLYHIVLWHGLFVYRYAQMRMSAMEGEAIGTFRSVYWQFCIDYSPLLICSGLIMPLFMLDFVRLTHRFVGPLVRATNAMQKLADGEPVPPLDFRKGDLVNEFQTAFNELVAAQNGRRSSGSARSTMTEAQAHTLSSVVTSPGPASVPAGA